MRKLNFFILILISLFSITAIAADEKKDTVSTQTNNPATVKDSAEFQKVIDEYKEYVAKIPADVRDEVVTYRKEISRLNKEKRLAYKKLSKASQDYLEQEQEYKKKLPFNRKSLINIENQGQSDKPKANKDEKN